MKYTLSIPLFLLFLASTASALALVTIKDSEAADHIREKDLIQVQGVVSEVLTTPQGNISINLGKKSPNELCAGVVQPHTTLLTQKAFLKSLKGRKVDIIGAIVLSDAKPVIKIFTRDQIKIEWKTAKEDPIDYLNGVLNDRYRKKLGLTQPLSETDLRKFKAYFDQNVTDWKDKDGEEIWRLFPKFRQASQ